MTAFRIVRAVVSEDDFLPPAKQPDHNAQSPKRCSNLALSFFNTRNKASRRFADLIDRGVDARARFGDQIASLDLEEADGLLSNKPSSTGHLNLYQEDGALFVARVKDVQPVTISGGDDHAS